MIRNLWNNITAWFSDRSDRRRLVQKFNSSAKEAFVSGIVPTYLKAEYSKGNSAYKHQFSDWFISGFRIVAFNGKILSKNELIKIAEVVLDDEQLIRQLVVLGFDTLEVHQENCNYGCRWPLKDQMVLHLQQNNNNDER